MIQRLLILLILVFVGAGFKPAPTEAKSSNTIPVEVVVDFGPAGKQAIQKQVEVSKGSTPRDAVSIILPIMTGLSCCDTREVISIDGIIVNPAENRWWICLLNGSKNVNPRTAKLKAGDIVQWKYITEVR
ncbi:MAG: hypothetical protein HYS56_06255 [Candidatus Omnitrophica bacterium]|nr:hypothetical protein [Candidatus Omnitrophota bacterium]